MGAMTTVELLTEHAKHMPEPLLQEVLDFMGYLRLKYNLPPLEAWDQQIDDDAESGAFAAAFDSLADDAIREHRAQSIRQCQSGRPLPGSVYAGGR